MNKTELLEGLEDSHQEMLEMLEDLPEEVLLEPGVVEDWSIKDILGHLTYWEGQIVTMLFQAQSGMAKPTTAHFGQESVDELNKRWHETGKDRPLDVVWQDWLGVRKQTIRRVSVLSENDLNDPQRFAWLDGTPLFQWILNDTIEHEDEHMDEIQDWLDQREPVQDEDEEEGPSNNGYNH